MGEYKGYRKADHYTIPQIAAALNDKIIYIISLLGLKGRRDGLDYVCFNPTRADRHLGSFRIITRGERRGFWIDFATGDKGDALALISYVKKCGTHEAIKKYAEPILGITDTCKPELPNVRERKTWDEAFEKEELERREKSGAMAKKVFLDAGDKIRGTPVDGYLVGRGINLAILGRVPGALRYHPDLYNAERRQGMDAMIALIQDCDGKPLALHRTYLERIGMDWRKADLQAPKKVMGPFKGGYIPIIKGKSGKPLPQAEEGERLFVAEGIETALSVALHFPDDRVIASVSVGNIQNLTLPAAIKTVVLCLDNDGESSGSPRAYDAAARRFIGEGRKVLEFAPPAEFGDFNDWQRALVKAGGSSSLFDSREGAE